MRTLDDIRNIHAGRPAVIAGSGPSLSKIDDRIYRCVVIAVNAAILKLDKADYFSSGDPGSMCHKYWDVLVNERDCPVLTSFVDATMQDRIVLWERRKDTKDWRVDLESHAVIDGSCSAHCAAHLAVLMGCSPVYLIGCDCRRSRSKKLYAWESDGDERGAPKPDFVECMAVARKTGTHPRPSFFIPGWEKIIDVNPSLKLYDASGGSLMDVVAQVKYDDVVSGVLDDAQHPGRPKPYSPFAYPENVAEITVLSPKSLQRGVERDHLRRVRSEARARRRGIKAK